MTGGRDLFKVAAHSAYERVFCTRVGCKLSIFRQFGLMRRTKFTKIESEAKQSLKREIDEDFGIVEFQQSPYCFTYNFSLEVRIKLSIYSASSEQPIKLQ